MSDDRPPEHWSASDEGEQQPLAPMLSSAQIIGTLALLGREPRRVLELGCGTGRILVPLAEAGHEVTGIERDGAHLRECRRKLGGRATRLVEADFAVCWPDDLGTFEFACCLGNTFMTVWDVDAAVALLRRVAACLEPGGAFLVDDIPGQFWPELTCGNWQAGTDDDASIQLVWADDDAVFELRRGDDVDEEDWTLGQVEGRMRLWTMGALRLAGAAAGLSAIERRAASALLVMRREAL